MRFIEYIYIEEFYNLRDICWSGAQQRLDEIEENNLEEEFMDYLRDNFFDDGEYTYTINELNDFIWFECDKWIDAHKGDNEYEI